MYVRYNPTDGTIVGVVNGPFDPSESHLDYIEVEDGTDVYGKAVGLDTMELVEVENGYGE